MRSEIRKPCASNSRQVSASIEGPPHTITRSVCGLSRGRCRSRDSFPATKRRQPPTVRVRLSRDCRIVIKLSTDQIPENLVAPQLIDEMLDHHRLPRPPNAVNQDDPREPLIDLRVLQDAHKRRDPRSRAKEV